jgi:Domain of unknown function (DUF1877)
MAGRGVHFALTAEEEARLVDEPDGDDDHLIDVLGEIEERWDRDWLVETDKAWDAIHRCLTDGTLNYGHDPLEKSGRTHQNQPRHSAQIRRFRRRPLFLGFRDA